MWPMAGLVVWKIDEKMTLVVCEMGYVSVPFSCVALCTVDLELDLSEAFTGPPGPMEEAADGSLGGVED